MTKKKNSSQNADQVSGGVFLIGLALLFLTGWWWPGVMFVVGASIIARTMAEGKPWQSATGAFWVIGIGILFGVPGLFAGINWGMIWPIALIGIGLFMLFGGNLRPSLNRYQDEAADEDEDYQQDYRYYDEAEESRRKNDTY